MDLPRFIPDLLNPKLVSGGIGDSFQKFVHEVLAKSMPGLEPFPARGKDGCIDLIHEESGSRTAIQAKYCEEDGPEAIRLAWKKDSRTLKRNLLSGSSPPVGQSQYAPWFRKDLPITRFLLCTSAQLANVAQVDKLREEIADFFRELSEANESLAHLARLSFASIEVWHWSVLSSLAAPQPLLSFRWFPSTRPFGLVPYEAPDAADNLRAYLSGLRLPFYSVQDFRNEHEDSVGEDLVTTEEILDLLGNETDSGVLICGAGGVGKTRLALEVAKRASQEGWLVLAHTSTLSESCIIELAERLSPDTQVLVFFDYMELHPNAAEPIDAINRLNDEYELHIRYLGTCRSAYYRTLKDIPRHRSVHLTAASSGDEGSQQAYLQAVVRHILACGGCTPGVEELRVCDDSPVLAVFLVYLKQTQRIQDLNELLGEGAFAVWVRKRIRRTLPQRMYDRELALLMGLLPFGTSAQISGDSPWAEEILNSLAADGWIEKVNNGDHGTWACLHDVFADQLLANYLEDHRWAPEPFLSDLLETAVTAKATASAITALQRIHELPFLGSVDWSTLLETSLAKEPESWISASLSIMSTPLLEPLERISLLVRHSHIWKPHIRMTAFQDSLGWHVRWAARQEEESVPGELMEGLTMWVEETAPFADKTAFVLAAGLELCPDVVMEQARQWILSRPSELRTEFLISSWLSAGLDVETVAGTVSIWLKRYSHLMHAGYLLSAWLKAGADIQFVQPAVHRFLQNYKGAQASYVFESWLKAGGDPQLVERPLLAWLGEQRGNDKAAFALKAWLDAGGGIASVEGQLLRWLDLNLDGERSHFVIEAWLKAGGSTATIRDRALAWLDSHLNDVSGNFVLQAWLRGGGDRCVVQDRLVDWLVAHFGDLEAGYVYAAWLEVGGDLAPILEPLSQWLAKHRARSETGHVYRAWLHAGQSSDALLASFLDWLGECGRRLEALSALTTWLSSDRELCTLKEHVLAWLREFPEEVQAGSLLESWLQAGGEPSIVLEPLKNWLRSFADTELADFLVKRWIEVVGVGDRGAEVVKTWVASVSVRAHSDFVVRVWLKHGGDLAMVQEHAIQWMEEHWEEESAGFLAKELAKQAKIPLSTIEKILSWCVRFREKDDSLWRLVHLKGHFCASTIAEKACESTECVFKYWFEEGSPTDQQIGLMRDVLGHLASADCLRWTANPKLSRVVRLCLSNQRFFAVPPAPHEFVQRCEVVQAVERAIVGAPPEEAVTRDELVRFLEYLDSWSNKHKQNSFKELDELGRVQDVVDVWAHITIS